MLVAAKILLAVEIALIVGAIAAVVGSFGFYAIAQMMGVRDMNGGLAMGVATTVLPIAGVIGTGLGLWLGIVVVRAAGAPTIWIGSLGILAIAGAVAAAYFVVPKLNDGNPYDLEGPRPVVYMEVRLPWPIQAGMADRFFRKSFESYASSHAQWDEPRQRDEDGLTILRFKVKLYWRVKDRQMVLWRADGGPKMVFDLPLPKEPESTEAYGPWKRVDYLLEGEGQRVPASKVYDYHIRTKIVMEGP